VARGEWKMGITRESTYGKNLCYLHMLAHTGEPPTFKHATPGEKHKLCGKTFAQEVFSILHSSPVEEMNEILNL
jgi:hypothetical protein